MEYTNGPWKLDETWMLIMGPKGEEIAAIHAGSGDSPRVQRASAYANARLIENAPALLEALEDANARACLESCADQQHVQVCMEERAIIALARN